VYKNKEFFARRTSDIAFSHALLLDNPSIQNTVRFQCRFQSCGYIFLTTSICSGKTRPNFFPCFKKNDIALGFKVVSGYGFQLYGYVFPISLAKNQTLTRFQVVTMYTSSFSSQYTHLTLACQHMHSRITTQVPYSAFTLELTQSMRSPVIGSFVFNVNP
jgi:hypothetical protein